MGEFLNGEQNSVARARQCLANNGGHLKDIVFHT